MNQVKPPVEKKLLLQILSVVVAVVLWFAITYTEDPSINITINGVTLKTVGENVLDRNMLVLVDREKLPNISVEVRGKRSDVRSVLNSITAKIDLSDITDVGEYTKDITYDVPNPSVMITKKKVTSITVSIQPAVEKDVPVYILQTGEDKNKEHLIKSTSQTQMVHIIGTQNDVSKINEALVTLDVSSMLDDFTETLPVTFADSNHNVVTPTNRLVADYKSISVDNNVYWRKMVSVALDPNLDMSEYQVVVKGFSKEKIEIGVKKEDYDQIDTIYADFIGGIMINPNGKYQMKLDVPNSVYCPSANSEMIMTADIERITTESMTIPVNAENVPEGTTASLDPNVVTVDLTGAKSKMANVVAKVDLTGLGKGSYEMPVVFVTDNTGVTVHNGHRITVNIS